MHVVPHALRTGANVSDDAGGHANTGSQRLGAAGVAEGIFGTQEIDRGEEYSPVSDPRRGG